ncbi:MAG: UDP-N-acetylglucosamine 2-epimerase (non-hydrolyzing) [Mariniphaga sp.]|nr:UDP-N-acetylglucosamine 2-epimerase (non-hydrolyzing) [Mariniphaga sp.]MDD4224996.1 UDP-N-acetylglucosamine 2-epimerase (non-hydrolyzing) [Mariniphaga sp.]MDD4426321.1 UDP-N-acetylglucosamine 2-epimerase (non-hydrolyzing) [Mariniphaga sp.]
MPRILTIVGARPQFVKAAALSRALKKYELEEIMVHTGQHFDENMADIFFRQMEIPEPKYNLGIHSLSHGAMTGRMLEELEKVMQTEKPDAVVVFGDTNSTLAGALAAAKLHIPVAHVEAGLRSFNMKMPEEINRIVTDRISSWLFCPTDTAVRNLLSEGYGNFHVRVENIGDVMYDVALFYSRISEKFATQFNGLKNRERLTVLATFHRQENTDNLKCLQNIVDALNVLNNEFSIVLPLHPRTKKILERENISLNFDPVDPVGYFDMIELLKNCTFVITDSGGLQKEAFFFKKQCLIIRDETEWTELVDLGYNYLVGADKEKILEKADAMRYSRMKFQEKPYGEGNAAEKIALILKEI